MTGWPVTHLRGTVAELHGERPAPGGRSVTVCTATDSALVLGRAQPLSDLAPAVALAVVRRRSGGGAVLVERGRLAWVDVWLPRGDPLWSDDVGRAFWWLGDAWARALAGLGVAGAEVHRGGLVASRWSRLVCFAGLGPGEVTVGGRKVVGLAQRRTREGALFQCAVPLAWDPAPLLACLALADADRAAAAAELAGAVLPLAGAGEDAVAAALAAALP